MIPGNEVEVKEGAPLAIGMTVICFGEGCKEQTVPFLDTVGLIRGKERKRGVVKDRRSESDQKRGDLLSKVSRTLRGSGPLKKVLEKVLAHIFSHLKRLDRGAFVLVDPGELNRISAICSVNKSGEDISASFSKEVVQSVLATGKTLIFSKGYTEGKSSLADTLKVHKIESVVCIPLIIGSRIMGAMYVDSLKRPDGFRRDDLLTLLDIGQRVALAVKTDLLASDLEEAAMSLAGDVID